ncbi:DUF3313 domain-containing protein [Vibrio alfacsensis]|uniref:DUF3313 domain-containing protein n=1 Tax=Vibrio alfacsensis TaxID=1074311 RepID=UPI0040678EEE
MLKSLVKDYFKVAVVFSLSFALIGCAGGPVVSATKFTRYEDFRPGPEGGVDLVWARAGLRDATRLKDKMDEYDSVVIDRVMMVVQESELDDDEIQELTTYMVEKLKERISPVKKIVDQPGEKTLRLSIAVSNVETPNPVLAVTSSILPVGLGISTISKITTGEHTNVGSATVELLVSDSESDTPLFAAIDRQAGNKDFSTMIDSLDDAKDAISWWVDRLGVTLSQDLSQQTP